MPGGPLNLFWMACPLAIAIASSISALGTKGEWRGRLFLAGYIAALAILDNWYWSIFPRGTGWFTLNRMSAAALLFAIIGGSWWVLLRRERREWRTTVLARSAEKDFEWPGVANMPLSEDEKEAEMDRFRDIFWATERKELP